MWVFKENTIAGDLGVTPIVQCLASMLITSSLVHTDLHHHAIAPLPFVYPHVEHLPDPRQLFQRRHKTKPSANKEKTAPLDPQTEKHGFMFYFWMLIRFIFEGTENNMLLARIPASRWFGRLLWTAAQGAAIGILFGFPLWCLAVLILGPIYGNGNLGHIWAPQIIKGVYGAIVGWITNPVIATLALGSQADCHLVVVNHDVEQSNASPTISTIPEEDSGLPTTPPQTRSKRGIPQSASAIFRSPKEGTSDRSRSRSSSLNRPPFTANVNLLSSVSLDAPRRPSTVSGGSLPRRTSEPGLASHRGSTVSGTSPSEATGDSGALFSYALGGTGGRAKRSRSSTETGSFTSPRSAPLGAQRAEFGQTNKSVGASPVATPIGRRLSWDGPEPGDAGTARRRGGTTTSLSSIRSAPGGRRRSAAVPPDIQITEENGERD